MGLVSDRLVLWDFDGTLAYRTGMWRGAMIEALDEHAPGHGVGAEQLRPFLRDGFPWHRHETGHPELGDPEAWWVPIQAMMAAAYEGVGIAPEPARALSRHARARFIDPTRAWSLFADVIPVITELRDAGWRHAILSNHVPELPALAAGLGIAELVEAIHTSAVTGYEKPHPRAFEIALDAAGHPDTVWMVGDNPVADAGGAQRLGIPAIVVRTPDPPRGRAARDLYAAAAIIRTGPRG
jgi:putative hydrolase of the HAD superfamily